MPDSTEQRVVPDTVLRDQPDGKDLIADQPDEKDFTTAEQPDKKDLNKKVQGSSASRRHGTVDQMIEACDPSALGRQGVASLIYPMVSKVTAESSALIPTDELEAKTFLISSMRLFLSILLIFCSRACELT